MKKIKRMSITLLMVGISLPLFSQDLVYRPVNPAFGGDSFNYQWLLSSAIEQNKFTEETDFSIFEDDPLAEFENSLNRLILSQLSQGLVEDVFGEDGLQEGTFEIGNFHIEIFSELDGVNINIFDNSTGNETSIVIPFF